MAIPEIVKSFEKQRPVCVMAQMALERLLDREKLNELFHETAAGQYERKLLFSSLVRLMSGVVLCREESVNAAYKKMTKELGVSLNAVYTKLERMETGLSQALVRYSYAQAKQVGDRLPKRKGVLVAGYEAKILDGNQLSATEHRLAETRASTAAPLPGKSLVVLDPRREAIADLFPLEDGHAQERSALDQVIETIARKDLWIADRNFTTLKFLYSIDAREAAFVIRHHSQLQGRSLGGRRFMGRTKAGLLYEQELELPPYEGRTLTVRRIELELYRTTRDGERTIAVLTNLSVAECPTAQVAEVYRKRWLIETAFQKLTVTLQCEVDTLCYPKAALFAFSSACLAYNAVSIVFAALRAEHGKPRVAELSFHYLSLQIYQAYDGLMVAVPPRYWTEIRNLSAATYATRLRKVARQLDFEYFRKSKRGPKKPKPKPRHRPKQVHVSSARILALRKQ